MHALPLFPVPGVSFTLYLYCSREADCKLTCFVESLWRNWITAWVLHNHSGGAMKISVDVDVGRLHVAFHQQLVLLSVPASNHQEVLAGDEPEELLKPVDLSCFVDCVDFCHLFEGSLGLLLGRLESHTSTFYSLSLLHCS